MIFALGLDSFFYLIFQKTIFKILISFFQDFGGSDKVSNYKVVKPNSHFS